MKLTLCNVCDQQFVSQYNAKYCKSCKIDAGEVRYLQTPYKINRSVISKKQI